jgi:hypothetical protein
MASTLRSPTAPLDMRSWSNYAAGRQSLRSSDVCELSPAQRTAAAETAPNVAVGT